MELMRTLLQDLRQKNLTLKEFCKRVRMTMGEEVLRQGHGLRRAQDNNRQRMEVASAAAAGGGAVAAPRRCRRRAPGCSLARRRPRRRLWRRLRSRARRMPRAPPLPPRRRRRPGAAADLVDVDAEKRRQEGLSATAKSGALKTAVPKERGRAASERPEAADPLPPCPTGCPLKECARMKSHLKKVQDHAESCQYSSMPGGQADCTTCCKWQDLKRTKEQGAASSSSSTSSRRRTAPRPPPPAATARRRRWRWRRTCEGRFR